MTGLDKDSEMSENGWNLKACKSQQNNSVLMEACSRILYTSRHYEKKITESQTLFWV